MSDFFGGGVTYQVNPAGSDITDFNLTTDRLDFGEISVHGLILGSLPERSFKLGSWHFDLFSLHTAIAHDLLNCDRQG